MTPDATRPDEWLKAPVDMHAASRAAMVADLTAAAAAMRQLRERLGLAPAGAVLLLGPCGEDEVAKVASLPGGERSERVEGEWISVTARAEVGGAVVIASRYYVVTAEQRAAMLATLHQAAVR